MYPHVEEEDEHDVDDEPVIVFFIVFLPSLLLSTVGLVMAALVHVKVSLKIQYTLVGNYRISNVPIRERILGS
jgi:hypothetical protein